MFDQNKLNTMTGTVKLFEWQNPHAWLQIEIADANGKAAIWSFEGGSPAQLAALGWKPVVGCSGRSVMNWRCR